MKFRLTVIVLLSMLITSVFFNAIHVQALERVEHENKLNNEHYTKLIAVIHQQMLESE